MPRAEFFVPLGLYAARNFFDAELCARLRNEAQSAAAVPATVRERGASYVVDERVRRTQVAEISDATSELVHSRLLDVKPALEEHFHVTAAGCRAPQLLVYRSGDFFGPHRDNSADADAPRMATGRQVSVVIFLNDETENPRRDSYAGGSLTFYGLVKDPPFDRFGFPLTGETGLLIAFRPDIAHEVTPVTHGERYTVVSWLEG